LRISTKKLTPTSTAVPSRSNGSDLGETHNGGPATDDARDIGRLLLMLRALSLLPALLLILKPVRDLCCCCGLTGGRSNRRKPPQRTPVSDSDRVVFPKKRGSRGFSALSVGMSRSGTLLLISFRLSSGSLLLSISPKTRDSDRAASLAALWELSDHCKLRRGFMVFRLLSSFPCLSRSLAAVRMLSMDDVSSSGCQSNGPSLTGSMLSKSRGLL